METVPPLFVHYTASYRRFRTHRLHPHPEDRLQCVPPKPKNATPQSRSQHSAAHFNNIPYCFTSTVLRSVNRQAAVSIRTHARTHTHTHTRIWRHSYSAYFDRGERDHRITLKWRHFTCVAHRGCGYIMGMCSWVIHDLWQILETKCSSACKPINPLKTKRRPLYVKPQSVPRCKHF
jgi:hypothetical protein